MSSKFFKLTFCNDSKDYDIVRLVGQVALSPNTDPIADLVNQALAQAFPRGWKPSVGMPKPSMGLMQAELLATSREYNPKSVHTKRFYSILVWGMRSKEITAADLALYAEAKTKTPLFDELLPSKARRFNFTEESK